MNDARNKNIVITAAAVFLIMAALIGLYAYIDDAYFNPERYRDRFEYPLYPLIYADVNDDSEYLLVKRRYNPPVSIEVITDTNAIKENAAVFYVHNKGEINAITPDGLIELYRDGERISSVSFDSINTISINYGTLQFEQVDELPDLD